MVNTPAYTTRAAWDRIAAGYDKTNTPTQMSLGKEGLRRVGLRSGMRFLDVAAGTGALSIPAARLGAQVLATDQSPVMLELLTVRAQKEGLTVETRVMDGHALDLPDNSFDIVGSQFGVMLFPDMPLGIREMARVVRPGGSVLLHACGDPHQIDFLGFLIGAIQSARPEFSGPPTDPAPLEFQLADRERLRREFAAARLRNFTVETVVERTEFGSGNALWDWIVSSNPIVDCVLGPLKLTTNETDVVRQTLEAMVRDRASGGHTDQPDQHRHRHEVMIRSTVAETYSTSSAQAACRKASVKGSRFAPVRLCCASTAGLASFSPLATLMNRGVRTRHAVVRRHSPVRAPPD
jgi:ubiquinone/menaquinone biosynthesis C-methylase UbiE